MSADKPEWQKALSAFFDQRGAAVEGPPSLDDLCFIAGRDPRVWREEATRNDLRESILSLTGAGQQSRILEVGSAAGFLAMLVAPQVGQFEGVDLAEAPLVVARRIGLANATFRQADGERLPFDDGSFDCAFCYDVFTNFPSLDDGKPLIREMLRVVKTGGSVLVGNIPDGARREDLQARVAEIGRDLDLRYGPLPTRPDRSAVSPLPASSLLARLSSALGLARSPAPEAPRIQPGIVTYDFDRASFTRLAERLGARVEIHEVHPLNPYRGFRFNAVFRAAAV